MSSVTTAAAGGKRRLFYNWISLFGVALTIAATVASLAVAVSYALLGLDIPYVGVFYLLLLMLGAAGLLIAAAGFWREAWLRARGPRPLLRLFTLDLNQVRHRRWAIAALVVFIVGGALIASAGYSGVAYMSSNAFCGGACHSVMGPEATAFEHSPHANVECVSCHVGPGAPSYVAAKMAGITRMLHVVTGDIVRPIPTPIADMRPARETCQGCHWPERFIGLKEKRYTFFDTDADNTPHYLSLLMKIGGKHSGGLMSGFGIHYHMQLARKVDFIARDARKQQIAWVRVTEKDGSTREYNSELKPLTEEERASLPVHRMDCMDCHNRPAHRFPTPARSMDTLLAAGAISPSLPFIKKRGVDALSSDYETTAIAMRAIDDKLRTFYATKHPELAKEHEEEITQAVSAIQDVYRRTTFPEMKASYKTYVDNIGHRDFPGCFRCHSDDLVSAGGEKIFTTCDKCHLVIDQGDAGAAALTGGLTFHHNADDSDINEQTLCTDCHDGT